MRWHRLRVVLGAVVWVGMAWGLQGLLRQSIWAQETADSWGLFCFHTWWVAWLLGGVGGWCLGRLGGGWTGRRATQARAQIADAERRKRKLTRLLAERSHPAAP